MENPQLTKPNQNKEAYQTVKLEIKDDGDRGAHFIDGPLE